jgi:hypothetical protein
MSNHVVIAIDSTPRSWGTWKVHLMSDHAVIAIDDSAPGSWCTWRVRK